MLKGWPLCPLELDPRERVTNRNPAILRLNCQIKVRLVHRLVHNIGARNAKGGKLSYETDHRHNKE